MIIRNMTANFGVLDGRSISFEQGLNVITAPNESGKSTWCAFLRVMLYGLDTAEREKQGEKPDRIKYAPWSKSLMSGSMDIEYEGRCITVRRWTEKANAPMQAFSVTYTGTDEPVPGLTAENLGETLTGVSRGVFERSAFIRQSGMALTNSAELERHIAAILSGGAEGQSYTETAKRLSLWQRHRKSGSHALAELENGKAENEDKLRRLRLNADEAAALDGQIESLRQERSEAVRRMEEARAAHRKKTLEELTAGRRRVQTAEKICAEAATVLEDRETGLKKSVFRGVTPEEAGEKLDMLREKTEAMQAEAARKRPVWLCYLLLVLLAAALTLSFLRPEFRLVLLGVSLLAAILFGVTLWRIAVRGRRARALTEERAGLLGRLGAEDESELEPLLSDYTAQWDETEKTRRQYERMQAQLEREREKQRQADAVLVESLDFSKGDSEAAQAGREVERLDEALDALREQRARLDGKAAATGDPVVIGSELETQNARLNALSEDYDAIALAAQVLAEADGEMQSRFSPELSRRTQELFAELTGGRYDEVTLSRELTAKARLAGESVGRETAFLSEGTGDQLYLALRLAVCEKAMPAEKACPMVLDDALVNFDGERMARALMCLRAMAQTRQILLFSCHEREREFFVNDPAVNKISTGL